MEGKSNLGFNADTENLIENEIQNDPNSGKCSTDTPLDSDACVVPENNDNLKTKQKDEYRDPEFKNVSKEEEKELPPVGVFALFRYASCCDGILIVVGLIVALVAGITRPASTIIFGQLVDKMINFSLNQNYTADILQRNVLSNNTISKEEFLRSTTELCIWYFACSVYVFVCNYIFVSFFSMAAANQAFRIRCLFMKAVLKQDMAWFDTHQTGGFATKISGDLSLIQDGIGEKIGICINYISMTILCLVCGMYYGWKLALVIFSLAPILTGSVALMSKILAAIASQEQEAYTAAGAVAEEVLSSIRTVVAFGGQQKEIERYEACLIPANHKSVKRGLVTGLSSAIFWFCLFAGYALAFWYGVKLIVEDMGKPEPEYTGGRVVTIFFNIMSASMLIGQTAPYFEAFALARGAAAKIFSIIEREPSIDISLDVGLKPKSTNGHILLRDVSFNYPSRPTVPVLSGLNMEVKPGETVALVGSSGCGKSTIVQLLLRFYEVNSGSVEIDGIDVRDLNLGWLRDCIGLVGQEPVLFSTTIEENIRMGRSGATFQEITEAAKIANAHNFIEGLPKKYQTLVGERGTQLSGGQKQRIAIARALVRNPKILLLDEATSALDTESEAVVQAALDQITEIDYQLLAVFQIRDISLHYLTHNTLINTKMSYLVVARHGRTTVVIAHRLSTIRNADKILVLDGGSIKEAGTHEELMEVKGIYYQLVVTQAKDENEEENETDTLNDVLDLERRNSVGSDDSRNMDRQISTVSQKSASRQISTTSTQGKEEEDEEMDPSKVSQIQLLKLAAPEWPYVVIGIISSLIMGAPLPLFSVIFGNILGVLSEPVDVIKEKNSLYCLLFLGMAVMMGIFSFLQVFMFSIAGTKLTFRLRKMVFTTMISQDIAFFDDSKNSVGSLSSRLSSDAGSIQGATGFRISTLVQAISTIAVCIFIGLFYQWKIGLVVLSFVPFVLIAAALSAKIDKGQMHREQKGMENASKLATEAIENIRTVASLHREEKFYQDYREALLNPLRKSRLQSHVRGVAYGFGVGTAYFANAASMYYGSFLIANEGLNYSDLLKIVQGVVAGTSVVGQALAFVPDYEKAKMAAARIFRLLELRPRIDAFSQEGTIKPTIEGFIDFSWVHFSYPSRPQINVLTGLNAAIKPGQTVALVGSSGSGKSTCVQLLERFYDPNKGKVVVDYDDIRELNVSNHRSHLALVSQEPVLFGRTIAQNIAYGDNFRQPDMNEIIEVARQANIHGFVSSLPQGYDTPVGDHGTQLSGGQKQRIAIARALIRNPKILLLDEATSALDSESEKVVQDALDKARSGRTCLVIAHRLTTVQNADRILVLHQGKIVEEGTHQELIDKKGVYYKLHNKYPNAEQ